MSEGPKMNVDPKDLVQGAEVTLRATVMSPILSGVTLSTGAGAIWVAKENYPAILSVTPPPVDWSGMVGKQVNLKDCVGPCTLIAAAKIWGVVETPNGNEVAVLVSDLTPLPDEPSAGEASKPDEYAKSDDRPAWQRASVGDVVRHRRWGECKVTAQIENSINVRLCLDRFGWASNDDILDIVKKADADANR